MSTDTAWLDEPLQNFRRIVWYSGWNSSSDEALQTLKNAILAHESQAVKAADKAARIDELKRIDGYAYGPDYGSYQEIRLKQLQGDSTGATPPIIDHRTDMEL